MLSSVPSRVRATALLISATVAASLLLAFVPATSATADTLPKDATTPTTVSTDLLPTAQINGVVWSEAVVGDIVYAGGNFTSARPAGAAKGTNESPRQNLMAFNITTGVMTSFAPTINGEVRAVTASPDGTRIYIGGVFDTVNGQARSRVAAFDTATGTLISSFKPIFNTRVNAIAATNSAVYVGGWFTSVNSQAHTYLAKVDAATGAVQAAFNPVLTDGTVAAVAVSPDGSQVVAGGSFQTANGSNGADGTGTGGYGLASFNTANGASLQFHANSVIRNAGTQAGITSLTSDADGVYGTGYVFGNGGNLEGMFHASWTDGNLIGMESCHGDSYGAAPQGDVVYLVGHSHYCGADGGFPQTSPDWTFQRAMAWSKAVVGVITPGANLGYYDFGNQPDMGILDWWPDLLTGTFTGQGQAAWSITSTSKYVVLGGEFVGVNNKAQQGLVRFAVPSIAPNKDGPRLSGSTFVPNVTSQTAGSARISWLANYDRDNANLKYDLLRDGNTATPIFTTNAISHIWWSRPQLGYIDKNLTPGSTHTYQVRTTDPFGNTTLSQSVSVTVATTGSLNSYDNSVISDGASSYWRLSETSGATAFDSVGFNDDAISGGVTQGTAGAIIGDADTADTFNGSNGLVSTQTAIPGPNTFALEGWFKTTSTSGGKIVGFGNTNTGTSSAYDRHVYMDPAGHLVFGVYTGNTVTIQGSKTYNDGAWHYFNASMSSAGMKLYVDGAKVGQNTSTTVGQAYNGYWRIGGDQSWNGNPYFNGSIDDVAVYPAPLTQTQITNHYVASGRTSTVNASPTDAYGAAVYAAQPDLYWRLGESSGTTAKDSGALGNDGTYQNGPTLGVTGGINGTSNTAVGFNGSNQFVSSNGTFSDPQVYTEEIWFNTTTTNGGKLIGFGNSQTGNSNSYDRHVWMQNSGRLAFGTYTGQENVALSDNSYNDGHWHYAVATQSSNGLKLYVDGALVATNPQTQAEHHDGIWRVGGDVTWENSNSYYFNGLLDDAAVYPTALDAATIQNHYQLGSGTVPNVLPTAAFTSSSTELDATFDASTSTDSDGTITSYSWDFGDGSTGSGKTPAHSYAVKGTYQVALTVTDNSGGTNTVTKPVTVSKANVAPTAAFVLSSTPGNLTVSFDATGSSDSDGTLTGYAWNYGDGTTDTGATPTHTFTTGGSHTVTLTVTDDGGLTATKSNTFTLTAPNVAPVASFSNTATGLSVAFNGSGSSDSDGTIASYAWDFGDGQTSSDASPTHVYASANTYTVNLTVTDDGGLTNSTVKSITVAAVNQVPVAAFSSSATDLTVAFDGSASADPDGSIASYAWAFGDGGTASSVSPSHTYGSAGTYSVTLTVTDDKGATKSLTKSVTVTAPAGTALATDAFGRSATSAWGNADSGGPWTISSTASNYNVGGGVGTMATPAGSTRTASLKSVSSSNVDMTVKISLDKAATGGGVYTYLVPRQVAANTLIARLWFQSTGVVQLQLLSGATIVQSSVVTGLSYTPGTKLQVRAQATGVSPTTLRAKVWKVGDPEPAAWRVTTSDTTSGLQAAGYIGLQSYVSASATATPVTVSFDDLTAIPAGTVVVTNQAPTAAFTSSTSLLTASFNGSGSSDPDGSIANYSWNYGDNTATGTGVSPSHTYATPGTYTVALTVTDNGGLTATKTLPVTVTAAANVAPTASFVSSTASLVASFDATASSDADGSIASYGWNFGDATSGVGATPSHTYLAAGTYSVTLTVTDNSGATSVKTASVAVTAPTTTALATDAFGRTTTAGFGTADTGGAWTISGTAANFNVAGGVGTITTAAGVTRTASLKSVSSSNVDLTAKISLDKAATGGGVYVGLVGRQVGAEAYTARLWFTAAGAVQVQILNGSTVVQAVTASGLTYVAGTQVQLRMQVTGTASPVVRARVWKTSDTEPTTWRVNSPIAAPTQAMQGPGYIGVTSYVSASATTTPIIVSFDDLSANPAQ